jgi:hypothetical protein
MSRTIWMGIAPGPVTTRVIAMAGATETILKARLCPEPKHPRALGTLLEAIALWQGRHVRAALAADEKVEGSDSMLFREVVPEDGGALYTLDWVPAGPRALYRHRDIRGFGDFSDLRQLTLREVAR